MLTMSSKPMNAKNARKAAATMLLQIVPSAGSALARETSASCTKFGDDTAMIHSSPPASMTVSTAAAVTDSAIPRMAAKTDGAAGLKWRFRNCQRELVLANDLGEAARGGDAARRERGETGRVDPAGLAGLADQVTVPVDDEAAPGVGILHEALNDGEDIPEVLFVHHQLGVLHRQVPL